MKNTKRFHLAWLMLLLINPVFAEESAGLESEPKITTESEAQAEEVSHEAFLQQELLELYRRDEVVITYFFMDAFFPLLMENCDKNTKKIFAEKYPLWQAQHKSKIDSGNSILRGKFKDNPEHIEQAMFFALQQLKMQSDEFLNSLCAEVNRIVSATDSDSDSDSESNQDKK